MDFDVKKTADWIADKIRAEGCSVYVNHSLNRFGERSSYIYALVWEGIKYETFGVRVSDHAVSSNRRRRDHHLIQHHIVNEVKDEDIQKIVEVARKCAATT
jgi:hypothetical protein